MKNLKNLKIIFDSLGVAYRRGVIFKIDFCREFKFMQKAISTASQGPRSKIMCEKNRGQKSRVRVPLEGGGVFYCFPVWFKFVIFIL